MRKTGNELRDHGTGRVFRQISHGNIRSDRRQGSVNSFRGAVVDVAAVDRSAVAVRFVFEVHARKASRERGLPNAYYAALGVDSAFGNFLLLKCGFRGEA